MSFAKYLIASLVAGSVCAIFLYGYVDRLVEQRLSSIQQSVLSGVYSEAFTVVEGDKITLDVLKEALLERKYSDAPEGLRNPGEFRQQDLQLSFITRSFPSPSGGVVPSSQVVFDGVTGEITNKTESAKKSFTLEPLLISPLGSGDQRVSRQKQLSELPQYLREAFIAIEDQRFYSHSGIDLYGIGRAAVKNLIAMSVVEGGSTITQQLAKNILFTSRRSLVRKILEVFAAFSLEQRLAKDQILEMYLNEVYFGQFGSIAVHGVGEAASTFFGKDIEKLNISESALLAGLVQAPSHYSPRKHMDRAVERRNLVLQAMQEQGFINEAQLKEAETFDVQVAKALPFQKRAPHFTASLRAELAPEMDFDAAIASGLAIFTGLDSRMQECAETSLTEGIEQIEKTYSGLKRKKKPLEGALVAIEPFTGLIKAWAGGRNYGRNQFDHAYQAERQIGSTVKPFLYLTALDRNLNDYKVATPLSILTDEPMKLVLETKQVWSPDNYDHQYRGDVSLRYALENSLNMPALYVGQKVGIPALARTLQAFHLADNPPKVPALALGALDTTLLRLTGAYAALANGGRYVKPRLFSSATDSEGNILSQRKMTEENVASEDAVFVLTNMLQGVLDRGTGKGARRLGYKGAAAGKTGTSNDTRDAWFAGFSPDLAVGVWVGFDDNAKTGITGGVASVPIWTSFKRCIEGFHEELQFIPPPGVVFVDIDSVTNKAANSHTPPEDIFKEAFVRGTEPEVHEPEQPTPATVEEKSAEEESPEEKGSGGFWQGIFR